MGPNWCGGGTKDTRDWGKYAANESFVISNIYLIQNPLILSAWSHLFTISADGSISHDVSVQSDMDPKGTNKQTSDLVTKEMQAMISEGIAFWMQYTLPK